MRGRVSALAWLRGYQPTWLRGDLAAGVTTVRDYLAFVSPSYADREFSSEEALLDHVRSTAPDRLPELEGVIAVDSPLLADAVRSS